MIAARRLQRSFADGHIAEEVEDLWEPWMRHANEALHDDRLLEIVQQELSKRCKKSKTRGPPATPAEVVLRMLLLKHTERAQAHARLELRSGDPRSARQPGVSGVYRRRRREGSRIQNHGASGASTGSGSHREVASPHGGDRPGTKSRIGPQDASGHHGGGNQYGTYASVSTIRPTARCWATAYGC